ncbi:DUF72 domain-containing protein [Xanthomonas massiliensis]|uniref:DUF72 domain-containing protein n=1 Tax=Xanthomonas massiliensis TaxID=1720302 RepID=UPI00082466E5|nr:DUF72 domain-containing protein [Xanthomonas massiliensis]
MTDLFDPPAPSIDGIHVGIGGWTYAPWRGGVFYPPGLVQRRELEYASRHVGAIEINGTWYGQQKPAIYAGWREQTPEGFVFTAKAPRRITAARRLAGNRAQVEDFVAGIAALGDRLAVLSWQFEDRARLDADDFAAFLELLPARVEGRRLRHAIEMRVAGFWTPELLALARRHGMALVYTDSPDHPSWADLSADFVYARLMRSAPGIATGYPEPALHDWARRLRCWRAGADPAELPHLAAPADGRARREVFAFFIAAAKQHNPAAAMRLIELLRSGA